jgi:hypothetical protein
MRYLKKYESLEDKLDRMCYHYKIKDYVINADGYIDVNGSVSLNRRNLSKLPLKFKNVRGSFYCYDNFLKDLEGCPKSVGDDFACNGNLLTNLIGCPESVGGYFSCNSNRLTNLEGCPKWVGDSFYCNNNQLTSLKGCPKFVGGHFHCQNNSIETFEGLDFIDIGGRFYCWENPIYQIWRLFEDHTKFEFFNDCDPIRENRVIILERLNFFLDYIGKDIVAEVSGYKCI